MAIQSAGIMVYRHTDKGVEVLLVHPAGPFWGRKDTWSIPKGELEADEDLMAGARREFTEEVGFAPPDSEFLDLGTSKQGSKTNYIWAVEGNPDILQFKCDSTFTMEWPPKSGIKQTFPENDKAKWFNLGEAKQKLFKAQTVFIDRLADLLKVGPADLPPAPQQASLF